MSGLFLPTIKTAASFFEMFWLKELKHLACIRFNAMADIYSPHRTLEQETSQKQMLSPAASAFALC